MRREIVTPERKVEHLYVKVEAADSSPEVVAGSAHVSVTDNGDGDYTLNLLLPGARLLGAFFTPIDAEVYPQVDISDSSGSAVNVVFKDTDGTPTATNCDFFALLVVSHDALER